MIEQLFRPSIVPRPSRDPFGDCKTVSGDETHFGLFKFDENQISESNQRPALRSLLSMAKERLNKGLVKATELC